MASASQEGLRFLAPLSDYPGTRRNSFSAETEGKEERMGAEAVIYSRRGS